MQLRNLAIAAILIVHPEFVRAALPQTGSGLKEARSGLGTTQSAIGVSIKAGIRHETVFDTDINSSGRYPGFGLNYWRSVRRGFTLRADAGFTTLTSLSINGVPVDMSERTKHYYDAGITMFYGFLTDWLAGGGLSYEHGRPLQFRGINEPDSRSHDAFLNSEIIRLFRISEANLWISYRLGINLTPGTDDIYTVNRILSLNHQFSLGWMYRL